MHYTIAHYADKNHIRPQRHHGIVVAVDWTAQCVQWECRHSSQWMIAPNSYLIALSFSRISKVLGQNYQGNVKIPEVIKWQNKCLQLQRIILGIPLNYLCHSRCNLLDYPATPVKSISVVRAKHFANPPVLFTVKKCEIWPRFSI